MRTIQARATINLAGLRAGQVAEVNPDEPRTKALLAKGYLVNVDPYATVEEEPPAPMREPRRPRPKQPPDTAEVEPEPAEPVEAANAAESAPSE